MTKSVFVIMKHNAKKAGLHYDLRFRMPDSVMWASFAVPKGVPTEPGPKVLAIRTKDHTKKGALITGRIKEGYGTGTLEVWDMGACNIIKYSDKYILLDLKGKKAKGKYHLFLIAKVREKDQKSYLLFKGKLPEKIYESTGMLSRIPSGGIAEDTEEGIDELTSSDLPWDKTPRTVGK